MAKRSMRLEGWTVQIRVRTKRRRRRVNGKARGFYEGKTVSLTVTDPQGRSRELHLGTERLSLKLAGDWDPRGGEKASNNNELEDVRQGGRKRGQKAAVMDDTRQRDERGRVDPRQRSLLAHLEERFPGAPRRGGRW